MPDIPDTTAGVVLTIGIAALLAAASGATVKIAGSELGATGTPGRVLTAVVGLVLVAWSAFSLREESFSVSDLGPASLTIVERDARGCITEIEIGVSVDFKHGPGTIRYQTWVNPDTPPELFRLEIKAIGSGTDLLGPHRVAVPQIIREGDQALDPSVTVVSPSHEFYSLKGRAGKLCTPA